MHLGTRRSTAGGACALLACLIWLPALAPAGDVGDAAAGQNAPTLEQTRLTMEKWIEIQQIVSKERREWQQGKEIVVGRLELVKKEISTLEQAIHEADARVAEAAAKRAELQAERARLDAARSKLVEVVTSMEADVRRLYKVLPEPAQQKLLPLYERIPEDPATTRASPAERLQNVLVILSDFNKACSDITTSYEVHTLANGKPSEVQALYVGLAQAYYVSSGGEAGIGRPTPDGWAWEPAPAIAKEVLLALEIAKGTQTPAFVPLPVSLP